MEKDAQKYEKTKQLKRNPIRPERVNTDSGGDERESSGDKQC